MVLDGVDEPKRIKKVVLPFVQEVVPLLIVIRINKNSDAVNIPSKKSLSAVEGDLPFPGDFLLLGSALFLSPYTGSFDYLEFS